MTMNIAMMMRLLSGTIVIKKRKAQKASIAEELLPIVWHPLRHWDWCMSEGEKRDTEALCA